MLRRIRTFGMFWYDFIVGDDWRVAAGVVGALLFTTILARTTHVSAWWLTAVVVMLSLLWSIGRAARRPAARYPDSSSSV